MSAGRMGHERVISDLALLAPKFRIAVELAIARCTAIGLDAIVYETFRSRELQAEYYARGRTVIPPKEPVTNAASNLYSWHGYGLAVDVISASRGWGVGREWFEEVAVCFRENGCRWGGEWKVPDLPHFQWGHCKPSPSQRARELFAGGGKHVVWEAVGGV